VSHSIQIESGVPLPTALEKIQVGESFVIKRSRLQPQSLKHLAKRVGIKITQRQVNCESRRIWRIA